MPITQTSWLTNLTENDLTENLSSIIVSLGQELRNNNNNIGDIVEDKLVSVKNAVAAISDEISALENSMPTNLIGGTSDAYGTATTGSVMGKLNYLIYLLAPTPTTINYSSAGTFNNITIGTGIKFISITACGGSGGGRVGTFFNGYQGNYKFNSNYSHYATGLVNSKYLTQGAIAGVNCYYKNSSSQNTTGIEAFFNSPGSYNYNAYGRRVNFIGSWNNKNTAIAACFGGGYTWTNNKDIYKTVSIAKNIVTAGGNAGTTASVSSQTLNVATSEVITVTVGAGGGNSAAGAASTVVGTNGTKSFSGGAAGAAGNTITYSNWTTIMNIGKKAWPKYTSRNGGTVTTFNAVHWGQNVYQNESNFHFSTTVTALTAATATVTGNAGKTTTANSLGKKGGAGGKGATGTISYYNNGNSSTLNIAGGAGSSGDSGYVRIAW